MRLALISLVALLAGCEPRSTVEREEYNRIEERLSQLEGQVTRMEAREVQQVSAPAPESVQIVEAKPQYSHQLIGTSFKDEGERYYTSEAKCEAARQTLLNAWATDDEQARQKGVVFRSRPTPTCLPI